MTTTTTTPTIVRYLHPRWECSMLRVNANGVTVDVDPEYLADAALAAVDYLVTGQNQYRDAMLAFLNEAGGLFHDRVAAMHPWYRRPEAVALAVDVIKLAANLVGYEELAAATIAAVARPEADKVS